jgi:hypothetical protein
MKRIIILAALAITTLTANAQHEIGTWTLQPKVGATLSNITNCDMNLYENGPKLGKATKPGYQVGVELEYQLAPQASIAAAIVYSDQGAKWKNGSIPGSNILYLRDVKLEADYINIPIVFNYYIINGLAVKAGIQPAFLTRVREKATSIQNGTENKENIDYKSNLKNFDFSIPVGASYEISNVVFDARYNFGITKIDKGDGDASKNSVFQFTLGYKFEL